MKLHSMSNRTKQSRKEKTFSCLLVNPPLCSDGCYEKTVAPLVPTQLISLATVLRKNGFRSNVLDLAIMNDPINQFIGVLDSLKPELVGFSNHTVINLDVIETLAKIAKEYGAKTLIGGVNPTNMQTEIRSCVPSADHLFTGFSEYSLLSFISGSDKPKIVNATHGSFSDHIPDISMLFELKHYTNNLYPIETQRGCKSRCRFCTSHMNTSSVRRKHELILEEIKAAYLSGFQDFFITDNTFTESKEHAIGLCNKIAEMRTAKAMDFSIIAMTRLDCVDEALLDCMRYAGIRSIGFGFESASKEVLEQYGKHLTHEKTRKILSQFAKHGIETTAFIMVGGPDDTNETLGVTFEAIDRLMAKRLLDFVTTSLFRPFPGTIYWKHPDQFGLEFEKSKSTFHDWGFFNGHAVSATSYLSKEEIEGWSSKFNKLNPKKPELAI